MAKPKPMEMSEAQQRALDILRRTPGAEEQARGVWKVIFEMIGDRADSATPKLKYYEVHHQREHARLAMLTAIADPTTTAGYQPVRMPMPEPIADTYQANSLYRTSAKGFFKDERAHRVGDILTVVVTIDDTARINNNTQRSRNSTNSAGMGGLFGAAFSNATGAAELGAAKARIDMQKDFVSALSDAIDRGVGQLVDADMEKESARLSALQVQQQLGIQSLSIANSNAQNILSLFR